MRDRMGLPIIVIIRGTEYPHNSVREAIRFHGHWVRLMLYRGVPRPGVVIRVGGVR